MHTLIRSDQDVPCMIRFSAAVANDSQFLKDIHLPEGSIVVFDRGYFGFTNFNRLSEDGITWVTRLRKHFSYDVLHDFPNLARKEGIVSDKHIILGHRISLRVEARIIKYKDPTSGDCYEFLTNNYRMPAVTIASLYKRRWQIELLFKRMKQNYPLKYFLGDSQNAIKIQIWCALIADLLLKIVKKGAAAKWSFSNLAAMVRQYLMTYIDPGCIAFTKQNRKLFIIR